VVGLAQGARVCQTSVMASRTFVVGTLLLLGGCARDARVAAPAMTVIDVELVSATAPVPVTGHIDTVTSAWVSKEEVEVEWHGSWWPATLIERRGTQHWLVHYDGYGEEWDEVVAEPRIRERRAKATPEEEEKSDDADP
jgi:hypothetical protein